MNQIVLNSDEVVSKFMQVMLEQETQFIAGRGIGVVDFDPCTKQGLLIAGLWYEAFNGANIMMHVAAMPNTRWISKELLWYGFYYPFIECGCKRVTGLVAESNWAARDFDERLGFHVEARLKDAAPDGDLLVYVMFRDECRWLGRRSSKLRNQVN